MSRIRWEDHTPHEIRMALESAPKLAGPWRKCEDVDGSTFWRRETSISAVMWRAPVALNAWARRRIDANLRADGFVLDDEEG